MRKQIYPKFYFSSLIFASGVSMMSTRLFTQVARLSNPSKRRSQRSIRQIRVPDSSQPPLNAIDCIAPIDAV